MFFLSSILKNNYILKKVEEIIIDEIYGTTQSIDTSYEIQGLIIPLTVEDLRYELSGIYKVGDARGYFLKEFAIGTKILSIETNDILVDGSINYRADLYNDYKWSTIELREVFLRRVQE